MHLGAAGGKKERKQKTTNVRPLSLSLSLQVNIAAVVASVVGAFFFAAAPIKAVQMLWVNLIMDSLASLALASEARARARPRAHLP